MHIPEGFIRVTLRLQQWLLLYASTNPNPEYYGTSSLKRHLHLRVAKDVMEAMRFSRSPIQVK